MPGRVPLLHVRRTPPRDGEPPTCRPKPVLDIARAGQAAGCKEALFTLGDQPELRYAAAREALAGSVPTSTLDYLEHRRRWC